jgi:PAS domain-containing protein
MDPASRWAGPVSDLAELTFGTEPDLVPRARLLVRSALLSSRPELADDAELVVSELVTNAALYGEPPVTVRVRVGSEVRVEVEDAGRHLPVMAHPEADATTGRGLSLVAAVATCWGIDQLPDHGKRVWAELTGYSDGGMGPVSDLPAIPGPWAPEDRSSLHTIRLGQVPTDLLLEAGAHIDAVLRELSLLREGEATSGIPLPPELGHLVEPLTVDFADGRHQIAGQAAAAAARGDDLTDLELRLDVGAVEPGERYLAALDEADRSARAAHLLALAAAPVHRILRQWCVGTAVEQLRARRDGTIPPPVRPLASVLGDHVGRLAGMADAAARLTLIETVTAELSSADTVAEMAEVVVEHAVRVLGVRSARVRVVTPRNTLRSVAWAGDPAGPFSRVEQEIPLDSDLPGPRVARTGVPLYIRSLPEAAGGSALGSRLQGLSARVLPLVVDGQVLGVLSLSFRTGDMTDEAELSLASSLAGLLARAMHVPLRREDIQGVVLELALQAAGVGTFDWDLVTGRLVWDRQLLDIFGRDGDSQLTIEDFYDHLHPADRDRLAAVLEHVVASVGTYEAEYRIVLPDGRVRWVAAQGRALPGPDGSTSRLLGVAQDTTERAEGRDRIARVMDAWATAFFFLDPAWRFAYVNGEAERVLGRRADDLIGGVIWDRFPAAVGSDFERWYRHAMETGEQVSFDAYYPEPLNAWYEVRAWPGPDGLAVYFLDITARRRAEEAAARTIGRVGLLARVTEELGASLDTGSAMRTLAQLVVPTLAEWCVVTLIDDEHPGGSRRGLTETFGWHEDPGLRRTVEDYASTRLGQMTDDALVVHAIESARSQVIDGNAMVRLRRMFAPDSEAASLLERLAPDSIAVLPLLGRDRPVGILSACKSSQRGRFGEVDLELLRDMAARAGVTLDRARLYRQQQHVAEALQRSMLTPPPVHGPRMAVRYVPASQVAQVGGDWYDAFDHPDGARIVIIGDVIGHDTLAAAAMGQVRTLLRTVVARHGRSPAAALSEAESVMAVLGVETLATVVVGRIEGHGGPHPRLVLANAGHPGPLLLGADGTVADLAGGPADPLLGMGAPVRHDEVAELPAGSTLVLYTDGLVERRDRPIEDGRRLLADVLARNADADVEDLCDAVVAAMVEGNAEDDVALIALRLPPRPAASRRG